MDVSIPGRIGPGLSIKTSTQTSLGSGARVNSQNQDSFDSLTTAQSLGSDAVKVNSASSRSIEELTRRAADAAAQISQLRQKQYTYADEASYLSEGDPLGENLQTLYDEAQTEIDRISTSTTYNGVNVLQAATYQGGYYDQSGGLVVSIPDSSSITTDYQLTLTDPDSATSAVSTLYEAALGASTYAKATGSRADASSKIQDGVSLSVNTDEASTVSESEKAAAEIQRKTSEIATTLKSKTSEVPIQDLIRNSEDSTDSESTDETTDTENTLNIVS